MTERNSTPMLDLLPAVTVCIVLVVVINVGLVRDPARFWLAVALFYLTWRYVLADPVARY